MDTTGSPNNSADRIREHSLIFALMQTGKRDQLLTELKSGVNARRDRALLVALDQGPGLGLTADVVFPFLQSRDRSVRTTAAWIVGQHPEWSAQVMPALTALLKENSAADEERLWQTSALFAQLSPASEVQQLIAQQLTRDTAAQHRKVALKTMSQAGLPETPAVWIDAVAGYIPQADSSELQLIFEAIRSWPMGKGVPEQLKAALLHLANESEVVSIDGEAGTELRIQAIGLAGPGIPLSAQMFELLVGSLVVISCLNADPRPLRFLDLPHLQKISERDCWRRFPESGRWSCQNFCLHSKRHPAKNWGSNWSRP